MESLAFFPAPALVPVPAPVPDSASPSVPDSASPPVPVVVADPFPSSPPTALGIFDLILRGQPHLTRVLVDERSLPGAVQRLLALSLLGLGVHGLVVGFAAQILHPELPYLGPLGHPALWMPLAFVLAFIGALCVCLPSFWFYTQLSGLDASFRLVTGQALRAQATSAVLLLGVTPFYAAVVLGCAAGVLPDAPSVIAVGLAAPFVVGLYGMRALYKGFCELASVLPITHRRRGDFLRRMVLCWGAVYTAVAPVALYRLAEAFGRLG